MTGSQSHLAFAFGGPLAPVGTAIEHLQDCCISEGGARLHRPLKKSLWSALYQGTTSVVPISRLFFFLSRL
jgi:hypothetical protein